MSKAKTRYPLRDNGFQWSCYPDLNWRPHPYQLISNPRNASIRRFGGIFVPEKRRQWCFPLHCLRPLVSYCGSGCGSQKPNRMDLILFWESNGAILFAQQPQTSFAFVDMLPYRPTKCKRPPTQILRRCKQKGHPSASRIAPYAFGSATAGPLSEPGCC